MPLRPVAIVFDVIETLMPLEPLRERFTAVGLPPHLLELWFSRTLRDGIALAATGDYAPFGEVAAQALRTVSGYQLDEAGIAHVLAGLSELPAHPDVLPAARLLAGAGMRMACLTNGSAAVTGAFVQRAGLGGYVERVISVEEVHPMLATPHLSRARFWPVRTSRAHCSQAAHPPVKFSSRELPSGAIVMILKSWSVTMTQPGSGADQKLARPGTSAASSGSPTASRRTAT
jgi:2-haloalkanoic acid dehalogenase type II